MTWKYSESIRIPSHSAYFHSASIRNAEWSFRNVEGFIRKDLEVDLEFSTNFSVHIWSGKKFKFWSTDYFSKNHLKIINGSYVTVQGFKLIGIFIKHKNKHIFFELIFLNFKLIFSHVFFFILVIFIIIFALFWHHVILFCYFLHFCDNKFLPNIKLKMFICSSVLCS